MLSPLARLLRCIECGAGLEVTEVAAHPADAEPSLDGWLDCRVCGERYPIIGGIPRILDIDERARLAAPGPDTAARPKIAGSPAGACNLLDYLRSLSEAWLADKLVLDVGTGSGRHSAQAAGLGARVVAIDLGGSIEVARRDLPADVLTVQADVERLPFAPQTFDLVVSIGVLNHVSNAEATLANLVRFVAHGGYLHVYVYWIPEITWQRAELRIVTAARRFVVRLPSPVLHGLCYPLAGALSAAVVLPSRTRGRRPRAQRLVRYLAPKINAECSFIALVNDQFDRLSTPIEQRFTRARLQVMLERAGLEDVVTIPNSGWVASGRRGQSHSDRTNPRGISVVVTVRNDRAGLQELLPGLAAQTVAPDEILIVDGGSVDGTLDALESFDLSGIPIRTTVVPGANIAAGRNLGVKLARNELIACTDAGCRPEPGWLAALKTQLEHADIVGGVFIAHGETEFERMVSLTHYPIPDELDDPPLLVRLSHQFFGRRYLASQAGGRSMAFRRDVWRALGGFPERQYAGEDQAFARAVVDSGFRATLARGAVVYWRPPGTWSATARMFYRYCRGDIRSKGRSRHILRATTWTLGPATFVKGGWRARAAIASGALAYLALPLHRARRDGIAPRAWWRIPMAVGIKDLAQIAGAAHGTIDAIRGVPQPTPQPPPPVRDGAESTEMRLRNPADLTSTAHQLGHRAAN